MGDGYKEIITTTVRGIKRRQCCVVAIFSNTKNRSFLLSLWTNKFECVFCAYHLIALGSTFLTRESERRRRAKLRAFTLTLTKIFCIGHYIGRFLDFFATFTGVKVSRASGKYDSVKLPLHCLLGRLFKMVRE